MFSLYFTLQIKHDIKHKQKTTRETRGNLEQSFARELLGNVGLVVHVEARESKFIAI